MIPPIDLESCLKLAQIAFYVTAGTVAVLTYVKAKNGLLNTINTEYHKKIIERLNALSEELYEEFDLLSEKHWARDRSADELVKRINEQVAGHKKRFMEEKDFLAIGIPVVESTVRLQNLAQKYSSDPFIPEPIRTSVVSLFEGRWKAQEAAHFAAAEQYAKYLHDGLGWDSMEENSGWVHNVIVDYVRKSGWGITDVETKVNSIRLQIEHYFQSFNPARPARKRDVAKEAASLIASREARWIGLEPDEHSPD